MGVLDFLFDGQAPQSVTTYGQTVQSMPQWYSDYTQGLIAKANAVAGQGYQPYDGQRIAGFTPDQQQAFGLTEGNVGMWKPGLDAAGNLTQQAGATDVTGAAAPYMAAASGNLPGNIGAYTDPYQSDVIDWAGTQAQRQFKEKILPALGTEFTRNGQYGSLAHQREADQNARDISSDLTQQSLAARSQGYQLAGQQYQTDAQRQAALAGTAGNLAAAEGNLQLGAGKQQGSIAALMSQLGLSDASALETVGKEQQGQNQSNLDLAYQDFQNQRDYPKNTVDWLSSVIRGIQAPVSTTETKTGPLPGATYGPSLIDNIGALGSLVKGWMSDNGG